MVPVILVIEPDQELRDGIETLLVRAGYCVIPVRNEEEAVTKAAENRPDLILLSTPLDRAQAVAEVSRIRNLAALEKRTPAVIFSAPGIDEGAEVAIGREIYLTRPDNFDQLRDLLRRLCARAAAAKKN